MTDRAETCPHRDKCWMPYFYSLSGPSWIISELCGYEKRGDIKDCPQYAEFEKEAEPCGQSQP